MHVCHSKAARRINTSNPCQRPQVHTRAVLQNLLSLFQQRPGNGPQASTVRKARDSLLQLLVSDTPYTREQVDQAVTTLADLRAPVKLSDLTGGPGVVLHTSGPAQLWDRFQRVATANSSRRKNRASQTFDASQRTVVNAAEVLGQALYITAEGTFEPQLEPGQQPTGQLPTPLAVTATITEGTLHLGPDVRVPLPIRGQGQFEILYCDPVLRIFRSGRSFSVQVQESYLDSQLSD